MWPSELRVQNLESLYRRSFPFTKKKEPLFLPKRLGFDAAFPQKVCIIVSDPDSRILQVFDKYKENFEYFEKYKRENPDNDLDNPEIFFALHAYYFLIKKAFERKKYKTFPTERSLQEYFEKNWESQISEIQGWYNQRFSFAVKMENDPLELYKQDYVTVRL